MVVSRGYFWEPLSFPSPSRVPWGGDVVAGAAPAAGTRHLLVLRGAVDVPSASEQEAPASSHSSVQRERALNLFYSEGTESF